MGWYWYRMGGVHIIPLKRYGITHGPSSKLSLFRLAYYPNRLSLPLVPYNIPYLLAWDWDGIWLRDSIPSHIFSVTNLNRLFKF